MFRRLKQWLFPIQAFLTAKIIKGCLWLLTKSCRVYVEGIERFHHLASHEKCILMLWHNRLAITPFILSRFAPNYRYAALVSGSRDGEILSRIICSYKNGNTIRVFHLSRYQALREIIRQINEKESILIITPDGPRGPRYEVKPGVAVAAIETNAHVIALNWEAKRYWELNTWDRLRLPKPFTTIRVSFEAPICLDSSTCSLEEAKAKLKKQLLQI